MKFENVTALAEGNVYFDGKVVSHAIFLPSGEKKTLGVFLPGSYHFGTEAAEKMEIVKGDCAYQIDDTEELVPVAAGAYFEVAANSGFTIVVEDEPCHYVCSYID